MREFFIDVIITFCLFLGIIAFGFMITDMNRIKDEIKTEIAGAE